MHDAPPVGLVSLARCAELLTQAGDTIDRSALSRYCDRYDLKREKRGKEVLVDFEEVRRHRSGNYTRQIMSGHEIAAPAAPAEPAVVERLEAQAHGGALVRREAQVSPIPSADDPARQLKQFELRRKLREEAVEEGRLTDTAEVDAGAADAIVAMRSAFAEVRADFAERLAAELGLPPERVRQLRAGLKRYDRVGQERFAILMAKALADANETASEAQDRLQALAAHALRLRSVRNPAFGAEAAAL